MFFIRLIIAFIVTRITSSFLLGVLAFFLMGAWSNYLKRKAWSAGTSQRQTVFMKTVFNLMGCLAKVDGHISEEEISHVERFMQKQGMSEENQAQAKQYFRHGAAPEFNIDAALNEFIQYCGQGNMRQVLLAYLAGIALADGKIHIAEEQLLRQVANTLGFNDQIFAHLMEMFRNQGHFSGGEQQYSYSQNTPPPQSAIDDAYAALGLSKTVTDVELKKAYRKLMSQYHPDKLTGQGVPEDMIKMATEKTKEIQIAYDLIKKARGL